jgi:hypothetical protein
MRYSDIRSAYSIQHGVSIIDIASLFSHLSLPLVLLVTHPVENIASDTHGMWWSATNTGARLILTVKEIWSGSIEWRLLKWSETQHRLNVYTCPSTENRGHYQMVTDVLPQCRLHQSYGFLSLVTIAIRCSRMFYFANEQLMGKPTFLLKMSRCN